MTQIRGAGMVRGGAWRLLRPRSLWLAVVVVGLTGCSLDKLLNTDQLPPEVTDPAITKTSDGALAVYRGLLVAFRDAFGGNKVRPSFVAATGLITDELAQGRQSWPEDQRLLPELAQFGSYDSRTYGPLQKVRGQAGQAIGLLTDYAPGTQALVGHAYALAGYAEVFLAELFCSGIPLSTLDYNGDYTLKPGSTTAQVLTHATAVFDTALTLAGDSARFLHLAAVGKGRALLGLGQYAAAAAAVAAVPDSFRYEVSYVGTDNFAYDQSAVDWIYSVADQEGTNGLNYVTSDDPRTPVTALNGTNPLGAPIYVPTQYNNGAGPIVLASGVEARLIEAEAALQADDATWLTTLNQLRATAGPPPIIIPADTIADTLGVTRCGTFYPICGHLPGGDDPVEFGQPVGGFPVPAGYSFVRADTTYPAPPGIGGHGGFCESKSYYRPCSVGDSMVVYVYVAPARMGAGLGPLDDPGTPAARVDLLFRERAFWLFLTGHRQGDLRRLLRPPYERFDGQIYPVGLYPGTPLLYGTDVTVPIPSAERELNPLFTGCASRGT